MSSRRIPTPTCPGVSPSSSPPRRWSVSAGTGGPRTAVAARGRARRRTPRDRSGTSPRRSIHRRRRVRSATRAPAPTTPSSRSRSSTWTADASTSRGTATPSRTWSHVVWNAHGPLTLLVESRDQRTMQILRVDPATGSDRTRPRGSRRPMARHHRGGFPRGSPTAAWCAPSISDDTKRLTFDDEPVTPVGLQVGARARRRRRRGASARTRTPPRRTCGAVDAAGALTRLTEEPGVHTAVVGSNVTVLTSATMTGLPTTDVLVDGDRAARSRRCRRDTGAPRDPDVLRRRRAGAPHGALHPRRRRARRAAAGAAGPLRRSARSRWSRGVLALPARVAVVRGPGVRGARDRRAGNPGTRAGLGAGGLPEPRRIRCSRTRSTACTPPPSGTRPRPRPASPSAAGPSAGSSRRWPCCAAPTSSTRRSPARPSPTGTLYDTHYTERYLGDARHRRRGVRAVPAARRRART